MKVNFTRNFFLKQFLPIEAGNCTILIVRSLAQGLLSNIPGGGGSQRGKEEAGIQKGQLEGQLEGAGGGKSP